VLRLRRDKDAGPTAIHDWLRLKAPGYDGSLFGDHAPVPAARPRGGVPRVIVPDNLKAAVIRAAFGVDDEPVLNRSYRELARHFGFRIDPTPPRSPEKKGKVERGGGYVKGNFLKTNDSVDIHVDRRALALWLSEIAAKRRHATTGRPPVELFEEEREALLPLPAKRWEPVVWKNAASR